MKLEFLSKQERQKLLEELEKKFGISGINYLFLKTGKEKIRAFSGSLSREELSALARAVNIELIGLYFAKQQGNNNEIRLSHDAVSLLRDKIIRNIIELTKDEAEKWLKGQDIEKKAEKGIFVLKHEDDLIGTGKSSGEKIINFVPKERRIKN